jgi:hypothetical protein
MKKQELQSLVQECIAEVLAEKYSEFQRVDKGKKGVVAKDKGEEETYGAGYAAGERAAKAKFKKLAEAYKKLKEDYDGGPEDLAAMAKSSNALRNKPETKELAKKAAEQAKSKDEAADIAVKLAKAKGIKDSEQITHIADLAASMLKKENIHNTAQMGGVTQSKGTAGYIDNTSKQDKEYADSVRKGMFAVEKPNGQVVKYLASEKEAQDWVSKNDPDGMIDFNIRKV